MNQVGQIEQRAIFVCGFTSAFSLFNFHYAVLCEFDLFGYFPIYELPSVQCTF